jgi:hypothetical protein
MTLLLRNLINVFVVINAENDTGMKIMNKPQQLKSMVGARAT